MAHDLGLVDGLVQLSFVVQGALGRVADEYDLSIVQVRLFGVLRDRKPTMFELAEFLHIDKSSVTGLVSRAERRGLLERHTSTDDRRTIHVALTRKGRAVVDKFAKRVEGEIDKLVDPLDAMERKALSMLATKIIYPKG